MATFNSYTVYDKQGNLLADGRASGGGAPGRPEPYFNSLPVEVQRRADVLLVLQEGGFVARYRVVQPVAPVPTLGAREGLYARRAP